jgi:hypothetical protein
MHRKLGGMHLLSQRSRARVGPRALDVRHATG